MESVNSRDILALVFRYLGCGDWSSVMRTCKVWDRIGTQVFDPSFENNLPLSVCVSLNLEVCCKHLLKDKRVEPWRAFVESLNLCVREAPLLSREVTWARYRILKMLFNDDRVRNTLGDRCAMKHVKVNEIFGRLETLIKMSCKGKRTESSPYCMCCLSVMVSDTYRSIFRKSKPN